MSVTTWFLEPEEVEAAIELYMVEEQGVHLDDIRSIAFVTTDKGQGPVFGGVQVALTIRENCKLPVLVDDIL
jgi:hypothetical protein